MKPKNVCIIIAGPTAVGKTSLAIKVAQHFKTEIISADSRQCYKELNIGVARPTAEQLQQIPHHFIASHSIYDEVNAAVFENYALAVANDIFGRNPVTVMVGGTGLYIKSFCEGMDDIPAIDPAIRKDITCQYNELGIEWLQQAIQQNDPDYYATGEIQNPQRLMRALEVKLSLGKSIRSFQQKQKKQRPFDIIKIGLELPREILYRQINTRVDEMMSQGLLDEVSKLLPQQHLNALQTVGYREIFDALNQKTSIDEAIELIKRNTRHYAKRQMTWFKKDEAIQWFSPLEYEALAEYLAKKVG